MRFFSRSLIGLFMIALTLGLLTLGGNTIYTAFQDRWSKEVKKRPARERVFSTDVMIAKLTDIEPTINSFGEIRSNRTLELRAPSGGNVIMLSESFEEGGVVRKGELLLKIDPADAQTAVDVARADLAEAEVQLLDARGSLQLSEDELSVDVAYANLVESEVQLAEAIGSLELAEGEVISAQEQLDLKKRAYDRQKNLRKRGVVTDSSLETAELSVSSAKQVLLSRQQAVKKAKLQLEQSGNVVNRRQLNLTDAGLSQKEAIQKAKLKLEQSGNIVNRRKLNLTDAQLSRRESIQKAKLKLEQSGNVVNRMKLNLANAQLSRRESIQKAKLKLEQSGNFVNRVKLNLADAERLLKDTELYAEFDGRLAEVNVTSGGLVNNNERLAKLIDPNDLEVSFRLSTAQYNFLSEKNKLSIGRPVEVALDIMGADLKVNGTLTRESASVVEGASGRLLFAKLNKPLGLRPGDFVSVSVKEPMLKDVFVMPASAVSGNDTILLVNAEDRLEEMKVELLRRQGENIVIRSDALEGKEIVSKATQLLGKGIKIKPIRAKAAGEEVFSGPEMIELDEERRARLIATVTANAYIPKNVKKKILKALSKKKVRADMVERIEK